MRWDGLRSDHNAPPLLAAGAAWAETWLRSLPAQRQTRLLRTAWITLGISGLVLASLMLPFVPVNSAWWRVQDATAHQFNMEIGWPELAATVAHVRDSIPASDRAALGVMAADEGEAGAVNLYGRAYGLPRAISGMNSNWLRGYGDPPPQTVIAVGFKPTNSTGSLPPARLLLNSRTRMASSTTFSATANGSTSVAISALPGRSSGRVSCTTGRDGTQMLATGRPVFPLPTALEMRPGDFA